MKRLFFLGSSLILSITFLAAQQKVDSVYLQTKIWSRDANHNIVYSDWKTFGCKTVALLQGYKSTGAALTDKYGGNTSYSFKATGLFYVEKKENRWWIIDPDGHPFYNIALNGLRQGKAPSNEKAFNDKFQTKENWIGQCKDLMNSTGFNTAGSWSDVETIRAFNKVSPKPLVYTTQLSLLGSFSQKRKKKSGNKEYPELAAVFSPDFPSYCYEKTKDIVDSKNDPNLYGHFSDNELPFQENLLKLFAEINDAGDPAFQLASKWIADNKIDLPNITKEQKDLFAGYVANEYYKIVSVAIKSADPNHLYIGSRLHSSAKTNDEVLKAAEKYADIISINYYGEWNVIPKHTAMWTKLNKPFIITEFYTKGEDSHMGNVTGAGWLVKTQEDRGIHYQNFCLALLQIKSCVGWHWFRYQDNAPDDTQADFSNKDSNKGLVNTQYEAYLPLSEKMKELNTQVYGLIKFFDRH